MKPVKCSHAGFSLIEVLVAAAVFTLLMLIFLQMTSGASALAGRSKRRMDALLDARSTLDRLAFDLDQRVHDPQAPLSIGKQAGSDSLTFYVGSTADSTSRPASTVSYRANNHVIERASQATSYGGTNALVYRPGIAPPPSDGDFDALTTAVFRMECSFLLKDHTIKETPPASMDGVASLLVAVAVMDKGEMDRLSSTQIDAVSSAFPDAADGTTILATWNPALSTLTNFIPQSAAGSVRIYQRCIPLE